MRQDDRREIRARAVSGVPHPRCCGRGRRPQRGRPRATGSAGRLRPRDPRRCGRAARGASRARARTAAAGPRETGAPRRPSTRARSAHPGPRRPRPAPCASTRGGNDSRAAGEPRPGPDPGSSSNRRGSSHRGYRRENVNHDTAHAARELLGQKRRLPRDPAAVGRRRAEERDTHRHGSGAPARRSQSPFRYSPSGQSSETG